MLFVAGGRSSAPEPVVTSALVVIPSRMAATRLPQKPLADIAGKPMIVRVLEQALAADIGPVTVACDDLRILEAVRDHGGAAVMTRPDHESGSDRIHEAAELIDPDGRHDVILNLQGDVPLIAPEAIRAAFAPLADPAVDIGTIMTEIRDEADKVDPSFVKAIASPLSGARHRALYFTRAIAPTGPGPLYQHIGVYAYRRKALSTFVTLAPSPLEKREKLEQLRALEAGMRIDISLIDSAPMDVNTPQDLERVRKVFASL
ncbi:3-deoxy-manno-octulosonate cytidylyltransferase [Microvirga tunisiensis]|uniref:3-deoxy-manno-octulosonate cytidylyltransferase n=1 Tax=Pannonibacter tanglangensis TaxID=2750084 RepID=A0ABW9ZQB1_9HYPH|nr:3-deoxy-manno-octulosonate cytidylyltransferase [Pannonibacter sp. XCT-34]NBN65766.1 3-deoxy-manno-octulosonate cytidylyltransferase [Pannonibacter sp. XCT-34]